jgi:hypothetical protein
MQSAEQAGEDSKGLKRKLRSVDSGFNWQQKCVLCCDTCELGSFDVRRVQMDRTCDTIVAACEKHGDEWGLEVKGRLQSCNNLMAEEAIYHVVCHRRFCENLSKTAGAVTVGRPVNLVAEKAFDKLCDELERTFDSGVEKIAM